jgi:hypothetical protein
MQFKDSVKLDIGVHTESNVNYLYVFLCNLLSWRWRTWVETRSFKKPKLSCVYGFSLCIYYMIIQRDVCLEEGTLQLPFPHTLLCLPSSRQTAICLYTEPDESSPRPSIQLLCDPFSDCPKFYVDLADDLLTSSFRTKPLYVFLLSPIRATWLTYLIPLVFSHPNNFWWGVRILKLLVRVFFVILLPPHS